MTQAAETNGLGSEVLGSSQSQPGCAEVEPQLQASEPAAALAVRLQEHMKLMWGAPMKAGSAPCQAVPVGLLHAAIERLRELEAALEPFAKIAGPIKGEAGRPTYLDAIMKGETEELSVTTIFDSGGRGAVLWADDFRAAAKALGADPRAGTTDPISRSGKTQDTTNQSLKQEG